FRGLVPKEALAKLYLGHRALEQPTVVRSRSGYESVVAAYPDHIVNIAAYFSNFEDEGKPLDDPELRHTTKKEVVDKFFEDEVMQLIDCIENPSHWLVRELRPMKLYASRRIALLGDAAHSMMPYLGAGAGQAIEDAFVLDRLFAIGGPEKGLSVLEAYNHVRQRYGYKIQRNSHDQGLYY
ncbi:hypothetical protein BT96DRAFT_804836, partial [Gymnopus androsaceus JB14]